MNSRAKIVAGLGVALGLSSLAWVGALAGTRFFDDYHSVFNNVSLKDARNIPDFFSDPGEFSFYGGGGHWRPVTLTSYALTFTMFGDSNVAFHAGNLAIHLLAVTACFFFLLLLFRLSGSPDPVMPAAVGGALFGIHPAASQVVHYVSSRSESLALLGVVSALVFHLASLEPSRRRGSRVLLSFATVLAVAFALASKETGIIAAPLLLAVDIVASPEPRAGWVDRSRRLALPILLTVVFALRLVSPGLVSGQSVGLIAAAQENATWQHEGLRANWTYWLLSVFPWNLAAWRELPASPMSQTLAMGSAVVLFGSLAVGTLLLFDPKRKFVGLSLVFMMVPLIPYSLKRLVLAINENRLYPSLIGLALIAAVAVKSYRSGEGPLVRIPRRRLGAVAFLVLVIFIARDWRSSWVWASEERVWMNAMRVSPHSGDIHAGLGLAYMRTEDWEAAEEQLLQALQKPGRRQAVTWDNLGMTAYWMGRKDEALERFRAAHQLDPGSVEILTNLGGVLLDMGRLSEARPYLEQAVETLADYCNAHIGLLYVLKGQDLPDEVVGRLRAVPSHCQGDPQLIEIRGWLAANGRR